MLNGQILITLLIFLGIYISQIKSPKNKGAKAEISREKHLIAYIRFRFEILSPKPNIQGISGAWRISAGYWFFLSVYSDYTFLLESLLLWSIALMTSFVSKINKKKDKEKANSYIVGFLTASFRASKNFCVHLLCILRN